MLVNKSDLVDKNELDKFVEFLKLDTNTAVIPTTAKSNSDLNAIIKEAIKLSPNDSDLYYSMALSYIELDSFETAYLNIDKALKLDENNCKLLKKIIFKKNINKLE